MKRILFSFFVLFNVVNNSFVVGQALVNYEFEILEFTQHSCPDGPGDDNESTWKLWYRDNTMGGTWQMGDCHFADDALPNIFQPTVNVYQAQMNTLATALDIRFDAWEDDCDGGTGTDRCTFNSSCLLGVQEDDDRENWNPYIGNGGVHPSINFRDSSYCEWHVYEYFVGCFSFKFRFKWEYSTISAGAPSISICGNSVQLNGSGSGVWSIIGGGSGGFVDNLDPATTFTGTSGQLYTLQFGSLPGCLTNQTSSTNVELLLSIPPQIQTSSQPCIGALQQFACSNGGSSYTWSAETLNNEIITGSSNQFNYLPSGNDVAVYVTIETTDGCISIDSLKYSLLASPVVDLGNDTAICTGIPISLNATNQNAELTSYLWNTGSTSSVLSVTSPGLYTVALTNLNSCTSIDTIIITNHPIQPLNLGSDVSFCLDESPITFDAGLQSTFVSYLWSDGSTGQTLTVSDFGSYFVSATDANSCITSDTVNVQPNYTYTNLLSSTDTTIFLGSSITFTAPDGVTYNWESGETSQTITLTPVENISTSVTTTLSNGCFIVATVNVLIDPNAVLFIPNMFSPNGDGSNDILLMYGGGIETMVFKIINRWGEVVFTTDSFNEMLLTGWDGKNNGIDQPSGVYVWTLEGTMIDGTSISNLNNTTGTILLRR
jgi:gliding motility-associated-like protein